MTQNIKNIKKTDLIALFDFLSPDEMILDDELFLIDQRRRYRSENALVLQPQNVENIQKIMRLCFEKHISVTPQGGNTGLVGGSVAKGGVILNLSKLNQVLDVNLADNTMTVEAGCVLQEIQHTAQEHNRLFPLSLASEGSCQIGGNIACNAGGLNVVRYGTMRDLVMGLEVVLPNGELISHLQPLHKNTTGYELKHLFIGSEGTLGIITKATLKLFAPPQSTETAWVGVENIDEAVKLLNLLKNRFSERVCSFELISDFALNLSSQFSQLAQPVSAKWHILIELTDSLPRDDLGDLLLNFLLENQFDNAIMARSEQERQNLWTLRENISASQRNLGASIKHDIAMPIQAVSAFIISCEHTLLQAFPKINLVVFGHLGDGSLHYNAFLPDVLDNGVYEYEDAVNSLVYQEVLAHHGTIAGEHGVGSLKKHWLPSVRTSAELDLMKAIKRHLDPHFLLNGDKLLP